VRSATFAFIVALGCAALAACDRAPPQPASPPPPAVPAPEPAAVATAPSSDPALAASAGAAPAPAAPPPLPAATILRSASAVEPSQRLPLAAGAEVVVDPKATFEIELSARVPDARLVLLDAREDLVPASGDREVGAGTRLTLTPSQALVPGARHALRLDGAAHRELHDDAGRAYAPVMFPILVAGTPPPPEPKAPGRKKKGR
jgi:hypothetical protein